MRLAIGTSPGDREVVWSSRGSDLRALVPGDDLWVVVKDDLLLREYESLGANIAAATGVVIDAGANVGTFTLELAATARRVIAVEANPATADLLERNLTRNGVDNVEVVRAALWIDDAGVELDVSRTASAASVVDERAAGARLPCPSTTLGSLIGEEEIDLLKIDIEGAEYAVIGAATVEELRRIRQIVGELHPFGGSPDHLVDRLHHAGFEVTIRRGPFFRPLAAMRVLATNARRVRGFRRLELVVAVTLVVSAIIAPFPGLRRRLAGPELWYLHATRIDQPVPMV